MELALAMARELPNADDDRVAAAGFSIGGATALLLAMRNSDVDGVIALDSSITSGQYSKGLTSSPNYDPAAVRIPLLDFRAIYPEGSQHALHVLDALRHSDRYSFIVRDFDHADFNNYALAFQTVTGGATKKGRNLGERRALYEAIAGKILQFLQGLMPGGPAAIGAVQSPLRAGATKLAEVTFAKAVPPSPSPAELLHLLKSDGFPQTLAVLEDAAAREPNAPVLSRAILNSIGYTLLQGGGARDAVGIFRFNLARHPGDLALHDSLAEALGKVHMACAAKEYAAIVVAVAAKGATASQQEKELAASATRRLEVLPAASLCAS